MKYFIIKVKFLPAIPKLTDGLNLGYNEVS
jgi:hypothetical protein